MTATAAHGTALPPDAELAILADRLTRSTVAVRTGRGFGSGVVWTADGLVVTNAHVARGDARVVLADGRAVIGRLLAVDVGRDLAVLAVRADGLHAVAVDDSDRVRVGQLVFAIGQPLGVRSALSAGVVHAIGGDRRFIRTTLRLAPGNSGGPLADAAGRVIGINAMIAGGLALAVPGNTVARFCASVERACRA